MKTRAPRPVADLLTDSVAGLDERLIEHRLRRTWAALVGPDVARHARPQSLLNGCLQIAVDNSPWLHELTLRSAEVRDRVAREFGTVTSVRFLLAGLPGETPDVPAAAPPRARPLAAADVREIESATATISDPAVAAAARRLLTKAWRSPQAGGVSR